MPSDLAPRFHSLRSAAPFWSLRYHDERREVLAMRQDTIEPPSLSFDRGAMLTAVVEGGYGYCATSDLSASGLQQALDRATRWAEATRGKSVVRYEPAKFGAPRGEYESSAGAEPPSRGAIHDLLAAECKAAQADERIVERFAALGLYEQERLYMTNTGGEVRQRFRFTVPYMRVTANKGTVTQARSLDYEQQGGFELVERARFVGSGARLAGEALQLLAAPNCPSEKMDLLLMPDQMMLQVHESIGHPLELDRILGDERNYAGTSFVTPEMFGTYRYGSELLNVTYDPTLRGELASFAYDDEGTPAQKVFLIRDGILLAPLGGRLSQARAGLPGTANSRACAWNRPPIDRMANLNVEPGTTSLEAMIGSIRRGILMRTNVSWSIDDSRNKFQFGCEWGELIEEGRRTQVVKNPNYRGVSATFWRSLRAVGDASTFEVHGTLYCGKGEPNQVIHCGHAAPACLFAGVDVFGGAE
ncbi:MAG: TldD/PmbA family protein [Betaproteobacteria bacterium]|nr:MAG: TldD/PmbA family protein [Betaproteobacteria bacterium]